VSRRISASSFKIASSCAASLPPWRSTAGQIVDRGRQFGICRQRRAHAHEGADDQDTDFNRLL